MTFNSELQSNNNDLRAILDKVKTLPNAGIELPELENEGSAADLLSGKQLINSEGNVVVGTLVPKADPVLQSKTVTPTNSVQNVAPDVGYGGLSGVTVEAIPSEYIVPDGTKSVTANGTHDVNAYKFVSVNVPVPDGYLKPSGNLSITQNGTHDVKNYASVDVNVASSGTGDYEIGTFTVNNDLTDGTATINPFIVGMTWQQFVDSPLNFIRFNGIIYGNYYVSNDLVAILPSAGFPCYVSTDGTMAGAVSSTEVITATAYNSYIIRPK